MSKSRDIADSAATINYIDGLTSDAQTQLNAKVENLTDLGVTATSTELNYVDGVTSNIQTQLDAKPDNLADLGVTATSTELNYVDGVTSNIQTQLNAKGVGSVTSVEGTGTVQGLTLSGLVNSSGTLTLGGSLSDVNLASQVTGTLPVNRGGTGSTTLTANNVLLGNGTSPLNKVAPSTSGNVLTSNGSTWVSSPPSGGLTYVTQTLSSSSSSVTFSGIPSGTKTIYIYFTNMTSTSGTEIRIGDSGGIETNSYAYLVKTIEIGEDSIFSEGNNAGSYWTVFSGRVDSMSGGMVTMGLADSSSNRWVFTSQGSEASSATFAAFSIGSGAKSLSGELTQLQILYNGSNGAKVTIAY